MTREPAKNPAASIRARFCSRPEPSLERTEMSYNGVKLISIARDSTRLSGTTSGTDISLA